MPFDYEAYTAKCSTMSEAALHKEWENYTRQIAGGATSTALSVGFAPITAGVSLVGLGLSTPRIHNARKKRAIIEQHLNALNTTHHTRKRDVIGSMAISGTIGGLTLGLAPVGADVAVSAGITELANAGVAEGVTHVALDGVGAAVEEKHSKKTQQKEQTKMLKKQQAMLAQFQKWKLEEESGKIPSHGGKLPEGMPSPAPSVVSPLPVYSENYFPPQAPPNLAPPAASSSTSTTPMAGPPAHPVYEESKIPMYIPQPQYSPQPAYSYNQLAPPSVPPRPASTGPMSYNQAYVPVSPMSTGSVYQQPFSPPSMPSRPVSTGPGLQNQYFPPPPATPVSPMSPAPSYYSQLSPPSIPARPASAAPSIENQYSSPHQPYSPQPAAGPGQVGTGEILYAPVPVPGAYSPAGIQNQYYPPPPGPPPQPSYTSAIYTNQYYPPPPPQPYIPSHNRSVSDVKVAVQSVAPIPPPYSVPMVTGDIKVPEVHVHTVELGSVHEVGQTPRQLEDSEDEEMSYEDYLEMKKMLKEAKKNRVRPVSAIY